VWVQEDLPIDDPVTDTLELHRVPEIEVPGHVWADWDHEEQRFLTAADRAEYDEDYELTALRKSVVTYPDDHFDRPLHDGSTYALADHILSFIFWFERGREDGLLYDPAVAADFDAAFPSFKGVEILDEDPLTVAYYSDTWTLDAENMVTPFAPTYGTYEWFGFWHMIALGKMATVDGELAFTEDTAEDLGVEWMDYTQGPSLPILEDKLLEAVEANYIPYEPTMGQYVTEDEALERWTNLHSFYEEYGHFWVGSGPFVLKDLDGVAEFVHLIRFEDYPDSANKWMWFLDS